LLPSSYAGAHISYAQLISRARPLNPAKYFIVLVHLLGNGFSSSPSNTPAPFHGADFPDVTIEDNVRLQYRLLTEHLKVRRIALIYGFSLGAIQGFAWAAAYPEMVRGLLAVCGSAKCWPLTGLIMDSAMMALKADPNFRGGHYTMVPEAGLRALSRVTLPWSHTAAFFRDGLYRNLGHESAEAIAQYWQNCAVATDANDFLSMFRTWKNSSTELEELRKITARTIVMPCDQDLYFSVDEARLEAAQIPNAEFRPIISPYGHLAGVPGLLCAETLFVEQAIRDLLAR
jgi:homoserine O-acetyltransferase